MNEKTKHFVCLFWKRELFKLYTETQRYRVILSLSSLPPFPLGEGWGEASVNFVYQRQCPYFCGFCVRKTNPCFRAAPYQGAQNVFS